ncbi:MAG: hypothetical protein ABSG27_00465 [Candidatus Acidiferrales bacterium]|jgi:hypothetical protein
MAKRAGYVALFCFVMVACLGNAACSGTPSDFNSVVLKLTAKQIGPKGVVTITATVPKDNTDAGVTWVFTPGANAPANPGTFVVVSTSEATYTAPPSVAAQFTVSVKATSIALPNESFTVTITIVPPQPLKVTTTALPNGVLGAVYPATTLQASGGVPPYTWSPSPTPAGFPPGLQLAADGTITGTPTASGTFNFTVQVTDSDTPPATTPPVSLSIGVTDLLNGNYAFEFSGFNSGGAVTLAGSFTADGLGNLTNGVEDLNTIAGPPTNQTFTGTYTLGGDNRGVLTFKSLPGSPAYAFAIDSTGAHGRLIELDASGIRGSGQIEKRTVSTCASNTINGNYVVGITGQETAFGANKAGPAVLVGSFLATPPAGPSGQGSLSGEDDTSTPGGITSQDISFSGTYQTTSQGTRCTMTLASSAFSNGLTFSVYPVSSSEAFLVETDKVSTTTEPFLTSGKLLQQVAFGGATGSTFTTTGSVAGLTGQFPTGGSYIPDLDLISLTGTGNTSYTISILENRGGTVIPYTTTSLNFVSSDQFGRVNSGISSPIGLIFYTINQNEAFAIGETFNNAIPIPFFGVFEPQSGSPFTAPSLDGTLVLGTSAPTTAPVSDISGVSTLASTSATAGTITGTEDVSASGGNAPSQIVTGTFSGLSSTTGVGAVALTAPATFSGEFLVVSPTKIIILTTTGNTDPVLLFLGNCQATCGED